MSLYSTPRRPTNPTSIMYSTTSPSSSLSNSRMVAMEISSFTLDPPEESINNESSSYLHFYVLPVLLLEFLALALTRAVLPHLLLQKYDTQVYMVMGVAECIRGLLAFVSCPLFGKLSDVVGRKPCLFVTVLGTCAPVCSLALLSWDNDATGGGSDSSTVDTMNTTIVDAVNVTDISEPDDETAGAALWPTYGGDSSSMNGSLHPHAITVFVVLLSLSGIFSSTFTLVFAYISDSVQKRDERVAAYGLALATFGLSFTIGPMAGGYLAQYHTRYVFVCSFFLTVVDLIYIYAVLPESLPSNNRNSTTSAGASIASLDLKATWSPMETMKIIAIDPFLRLVGKISFLYYTALWAVISTLVLYAAKRFSLGPERLGELMSALGFSTMIAEAVMVRIMVPMLGEKRSMRLGLAAFGIQCAILGLAYEGWHLFACIVFSMVGNLVYPSLTSLVSSSVEPSAVGEALGAINGIKALTEGIGPLVFGSLMTLSEHSALPGWPYLLAALIVYLAYYYSAFLPDSDSDDFVHELERKKRRRQQRETPPPRYLRIFSRNKTVEEDAEDEYENLLGSSSDDDDDEQVAMLSEIEESDEEGFYLDQPEPSPARASSPPLSPVKFASPKTPVSFASLMGKPLEPIGKAPR